MVVMPMPSFEQAYFYMVMTPMRMLVLGHAYKHGYIADAEV